MKKKLVASLVTACLVLPSVLSLTGCGAKISELDWPNILHYNSISFTVFEIPKERALTYYLGDFNNIKEKTGSYTVGLSNAYEGDSAENFTISSISAQYYCRYTENVSGVQFMVRPYNGEWIERINDNYYKGDYRYVHNTRKEEYDGEEFTEPVMYASVIDWARNNCAAFEKTSETENTVTYTAKGDLSALTTMCQTVYASSTVSEMQIFFEKDVYSNQGVSQESSDLYRVDRISVKDQNGLLFVMKDVDTVILEELHDMVFGVFYDESNFTLKGGEGIDYGEYYFTKDAVRVYTPKNPDADKKEYYLSADRENNTAKRIVKTQSGYDVQTISMEQFNQMKQSLIDTFFSGIVKYGYGHFRQYDDCVNLHESGNYSVLWKAKEIHGAALGVAVTYKNVSLRFNDGYVGDEGHKTVFKEGSFDYVLSSGGQSVTHHMKLTNGGKTTVTIPQV